MGLEWELYSLCLPIGRVVAEVRLGVGEGLSVRCRSSVCVVWFRSGWSVVLAVLGWFAPPAVFRFVSVSGR